MIPNSSSYDLVDTMKINFKTLINLSAMKNKKLSFKLVFTLMMLAARQWLRPWLTRRHAHRLAGLDARLAREGASLLFALRMLPVLPFSLTNIAAGMAGMKAWPFFRVSFAGMLIGTVVYVNAGAQMASIDSVDALVSPRIVASLAAIAVVPWLAGHLARRMGWSAATPAKEA